MTENIRALMVVPRNTVPAQNVQRLIGTEDFIYTYEPMNLKFAFVKDTGFGLERKKLVLSDLNGLDPQEFSQLMRELTGEYEESFRGYPLMVDVTDLKAPYLAELARLGFMPFLGKYGSQSEDDSEEIWRILTEKLRAFSRGEME